MDDPDALRMTLVMQLKGHGVVLSEAVEQALRMVPRHRFVPEVSPEHAYRDDAVVVRRDDDGRALASASQPTVVATMLEQLHVSSGHRILEVGTGTGYNAALLSVLARPEGEVFSVEVEPVLAERARTILTNLRFVHVHVVTGDGQGGYPAGSPYDRIIVTTGAREVATSWTEQLADEGRLVVPVVDEAGVGSVFVFDKLDGELVCREQTPCGFLPMRPPSQP